MIQEEKDPYKQTYLAIPFVIICIVVGIIFALIHNYLGTRG